MPTQLSGPGGKPNFLISVGSDLFVSGLFLLLSLCLMGSCNSVKKQEKLLVAVAANASAPIAEIVRVFEEKTGIVIELVTGSSGKLSSQILNGAPYNVFISADQKYPQTIFEADKAQEKPLVYGRGYLVLWVSNSAIKSLRPGSVLNPSFSMDSSQSSKNRDSLAAMASHKLQLPSSGKIALANPDLAPYGRAAREYLSATGLLDGLIPRLIYGESIGQVNNFISTGAVEAAFTAYSSALGEFETTETGGSFILIPDSLYAPIYQSAVLLKSVHNAYSPLSQHQALQFYDFLQSGDAHLIFKRYGYGTTDLPN